MRMKCKIGDILKFFGILMMVVALSSCGSSLNETVDEILDEQLPAQSPGDEEVPEALLSPDALEDMEKASEDSVEALMEESKEVEWSSEIPEIFLEFKEGYCVDIHHIADNQEDIWMLTYVDVDLGDVDAYNRGLEKNGWVKTDEVFDVVYAYTKDNHETIEKLGENEDGSIWYTLYLSYEVGNESSSDLNQMSVRDVPMGYPKDEIPIYTSPTSKIVGATEINAGGSTVYSIEIACDETTKEIVEVIYPYLEKLSKDMASQILMEGNALLQGASKEWHYTIFVEAVAYNDQATSVVYQVTPMDE